MKTLNEKEKAARYDKNMKSHIRHNAKNALIVIKAKQQGINVSDVEIDAYLKNKGK